jgi:membrane-bound serine protease (ClpP class)
MRSPLSIVYAFVRGKGKGGGVMDITQVIFNTLTNPDVAYVLLILGLFSAVIAFAAPGTGFAEVSAGLCLLLAIIGLAQLPVQPAGILLILIGIGLFILDLKLQSGAIAIGGAMALGLGSIFLFPPSPAQMSVSLWLIVLVTLGSAVFFGFGLTRAMQAMRLRPKMDIRSMVGTRGIIRTPVLPSTDWTGTAQVGSELWSVRSDETLPTGVEIVVDRVDGLMLHVSRVHQDGSQITAR